MSHLKTDQERRRWPAWLIGLIIAVILFTLAVFVFDAFGFGDEPAVGSLAALHV